MLYTNYCKISAKGFLTHNAEQFQFRVYNPVFLTDDHQSPCTMYILEGTGIYNPWALLHTSHSLNS